VRGSGGSSPVLLDVCPESEPSERRELEGNLCFAGDGRRPSGGGKQVQPSNHLLVLWSKATVLSNEGKGQGIGEV